MKRVCVVCEGQTEETFVRDLLAPALHPLELYLFPEMINTSPGHRGGALSYARVKRHLRNTLRQASAPVVTTLIDLYRLDTSFPGHAESLRQGDLAKRLGVLNEALKRDVVAEAGCAPERFLPHIQPHEFEALLFSDIHALTQVETGWQVAALPLAAARQAAESPEHINDGQDTSPAARLAKALNHPRYSKALHGPLAAQRVGLDRMQAECRFFAGWVTRLRALADG